MKKARKIVSLMFVLALAFVANAVHAAVDITASSTEAFDGGISQLVTILLYCLGVGISLVLGLAGLFAAVKWVQGKIQGRRK